jgi:hypothetical protein
MGKINPKFDIKRFLWVVVPFTLVAAFMLYMKPKDPNAGRPNPFPLHNLHLVGQNVQGNIILNGISIANYKLGETKRSTTISLTSWLTNGENKLQVSINKSKAPKSQETSTLKASVHFQPKLGTITKNQLFELKNLPPLNSNDSDIPQTYFIQASELPEWGWSKGKADFHDIREIKAAVYKLHSAFKKKNISAIRETEKFLFDDMERLTGREGLERRQYRGEIILKGEPEPLGQLRVIPYADGKVVRVTNKDGLAPIRVYFRYGNGGKIILTGQYWSKINGQWYVVR